MTESDIGSILRSSNTSDRHTDFDSGRITHMSRYTLPRSRLHVHCRQSTCVTVTSGIAHQICAHFDARKLFLES